METMIVITMDFSSETTKERRQWDNISKDSNKKTTRSNKGRQ